MEPTWKKPQKFGLIVKENIRKKKVTKKKKKSEAQSYKLAITIFLKSLIYYLTLSQTSLLSHTTTMTTKTQLASPTTTTPQPTDAVIHATTQKAEYK